MAKQLINTSQKVVPMIYAYSTPEIARHNGWTKIGYTEQDVYKRLEQQTHTADVICKLEWKGNAVFDDGSGRRFTDREFHAYLQKQAVERKAGTEWFHISGEDSKQKFYNFRADGGILETLDTVIPYKLRKEQNDAIDLAKDYREKHRNAEVLWNAKPRFGKTLSVYDLCKQINARMVLIVTNRPAIANSWYDDYVKFMGTQSGYLFVSDVDSLKGKAHVVPSEKYPSAMLNGGYKGKIQFVSLQDMKGSVYFGGKINKLEEIANVKWDILVIDEAHEGVDTYKTDVAFDRIKRDFTLHLSGTPFKALANDKFDTRAIFNWTYADEQKAKRDWVSEDEENPYITLPKLNLFTYQMSEIIKDEVKKGIEIDGDTEEYAFDLNDFFEVKNGRFSHEESVDKFLNALTYMEKYPFSTQELRDELKHTFWLLNRVESAKLLAKKLENHPVFKDYKIVLAAGDGKIDDTDESRKSYDKVVEAIKNNDKTITISVGQLTTGITIPQWTAVLMLSNIKSPALYMQAAFRAQNPCLFEDKNGFYRKENAYVFDFDPARTLTIFEQFANDLASDTSSGRGDSRTRRKHVHELLNFFPVIGEDEDGEMVELDAEQVLSIPRRIRSKEVVKRGFMSNFLFQNISNLFGAPKEVYDMLNKFEPVKRPKNNKIDQQQAKDIPVDENGDVKLEDEYVLGKAADLFGAKIYDTRPDLEDKLDYFDIGIHDEKFDMAKRLTDLVKEKAITPIISTAEENYKDVLKTSDKRKMEKSLTEEAERIFKKEYAEFQTSQNIARTEFKKAIENKDEQEVRRLTEAYEETKKTNLEDWKEKIGQTIDDFISKTQTEVVATIETNIQQDKADSVENSIRDHLRGFSRTIPSFLMAYGNDEVTLENFDTIIPDEVFKEVTGITLDNFRFLRDGGEYTDSETGETKIFGGKLFDSVVFNDSIKEFLSLKKKLANYFDENNTEDIFDYIPPQRTNQIFTPKWVVKKMVDMLEEENPGCFDNPDKTFIDLYMKSGLYITEIVKKLYNSEKMKEAYPDSHQRLKHIFEKQVYGLAPTEIIYRIAISFILGFDENLEIQHHNLKCADALPYAINGNMEELLEELYG